MANFSVKDDLQFRAANQRLEILAISGPTAQWVMERLRDKKFAEIEARYSFTVSPAAAERIVAKYAASIIR